jgi:hypothetical protein
VRRAAGECGVVIVRLKGKEVRWRNEIGEP